MNTALDTFPTTTHIVHENLHFNYSLLHLDTVEDCLVVGIDGGVTPVPDEDEVDNLLCNVTEGLLGVGGHTPLPGETEDWGEETKLGHRLL